jgi:hypothetical protein
MLEKHRTSIYRSLVPILGEEETEAMMSHFPTADGDRFVTHDHLTAELALTRTELKTEMGELRTELKTEMGELRTELKTEMGELRTELKTEMGELRTEMHQLANRTIVTLVSTMVALAGVIVAGVALTG